MIVSKVSKITRESILTKAVGHFTAHGFRSVRVEDIAASLGMSKKTFYRYFPSKEALVRAVVFFVMERMFSRLEKVVESDLPVLRKVDTLLDVVTEQFRQLPRSAPVDLMRVYPNLLDEVLARRRQFLRRYLAVIEEGQRSGEVRTDFPAEILTGAVIALVDTIGTPRFLEGSNIDFVDAVQLIRAFVVGGLSAKAQEVTS